MQPLNYSNQCQQQRQRQRRRRLYLYTTTTRLQQYRTVYRMAVFPVKFNRGKSVDLDAGDVIGGDINLRHDDVIVVGIVLGKLAPYWSQTSTVHTPWSVCVQQTHSIRSVKPVTAAAIQYHTTSHNSSTIYYTAVLILHIMVFALSVRLFRTGSLLESKNA